MNDQEASDGYNREPRDRYREQKPKRDKFERKPGQKRLTKEEYVALVIYANETGIDRKSVVDVEAALKAGGKSVQYWLDRKRTDGGPRSHHAGQPDNSNRDEKKDDKDDGFSNKKLKDLGRPRECPFHKKGSCKEGDLRNMSHSKARETEFSHKSHHKGTTAEGGTNSESNSSEGYGDFSISLTGNQT